MSYDPNNDTYSVLFDLHDPLLGDDSLGLLSDAPVGLASAAPAPSSTLTTPDLPPSTPILTVNSSLANKRRKGTPARVVKKTESVD